jgi:glycosyltransferase involved in cell wall biosynthesis
MKEGMKMAFLKSVGLMFADMIVFFPLLLLSIIARFAKKPWDIGLGPEPLVSHIYHKKAFELYGYRTETFVADVYFITDEFDLRGHKILPIKRLFPGLKYLIYLYLFAASLFRYRCLYLYFNGGPLGLATSLLWRVEPFLYWIAKVKVVVMPYGGDVQEMSRAPNLLYKHAMSCDYPVHRFRRGRIAAKIDLWTRYADHIIAGCDWVYYLYHWDTLMMAHFSIDMEAWKPVPIAGDPLPSSAKRKLRIFHAPNHRAIKGTAHILRAVDELIEEGLDIELILAERVSNQEIKRLMAAADIVVDQLIVGWYAMFAIEAMAMEKPVLCYLRQDLMELFVTSGLVAADEIPILNCSPLTIKETLRSLVLNRDELPDIGKRSRAYVMKHHSIQVVGKVFDEINRSIGLKPGGK